VFAKRQIPSARSVAAAIAVVVLAGSGALPGPMQPVAAEANGDSVFTVAKYPVEASGKNAVAAKRDALDKGRRAAFRSLLKRLVPSASYGQVEALKSLDPENLVGGMRVRSEENSSTQYIATLDFSFAPDAVRRLLADNSVPYLDNQAPVSQLVLLYKEPATEPKGVMADRQGGATWRIVWRDLDLANSLAPLKLAAPAADLAAETKQALLAADPQAMSMLTARYGSPQVVIAAVEPQPQARELHVTLAGRDSVGPFSVTTRYRLDNEDFTYSLELAAVIAQGVLEGRWKSQMLGGGSTETAHQGAATPLRVVAEFNNLGHWQRQQQVLADTPGVRNLQVGGLSGRSATLELNYPGGGQALQAALNPRGLTLENINGFWILR